MVCEQSEIGLTRSPILIVGLASHLPRRSLTAATVATLAEPRSAHSFRLEPTPHSSCRMALPTVAPSFQPQQYPTDLGRDWFFDVDRHLARGTDRDRPLFPTSHFADVVYALG